MKPKIKHLRQYNLVDVETGATRKTLFLTTGEANRAQKFYPPGTFRLELQRKGGATRVYGVENGRRKEAYAICNPEDIFCKRTGRHLAMKRFAMGEAVDSRVLVEA